MKGSPSGRANLYRYKRIKAKDGDKIGMIIRAKGTGIAEAALYHYPKDGFWRWIGNARVPFKVSSEWKTYKKILTVKGLEPTGNVCVVIGACKNSTINVSEVKAEKN